MVSSRKGCPGSSSSLLANGLQVQSVGRLASLPRPHLQTRSLPPAAPHICLPCRYYLVVLANPPDTGDEEGGRLFTIDIDRVPREQLGKQPL